MVAVITMSRTSIQIFNYYEKSEEIQS